MLRIKQTKKLISTAMAIILAGGLLLTPGTEKATAQGGILNSNQETAVTISNTDIPNEKQTLVSAVEKNVEQESSSPVLQEATSLQENNSILSSLQNGKETKALLLEDQLSSVTNNVYLQANESRHTTLNVLATEEQLRKKKQQLPSTDVIREITEKRTPNSKHYLLKDGTYRAVISSTDVHYKDAYGRYQDIVPSLVDEQSIIFNDETSSKESSEELKRIESLNKSIGRNRESKMDEGAYKALHVPFDNRIPKLYSKGYQVKQGNDQLQFIPVNARNVTGSVYDSQTILYQNAWDQVDVTLSITDTGIKETLILNTPDTPNTFLFEVNGNIDEQLSSANFQLQPAWLEDSLGEFRNVEQKMILMKGKRYVQLTADLSQLSYPIKIDPTVTIKDSFQDVSYNMSDCPTCDGIGSYISPTLRIGRSGSDRFAAYIKFGLNQITTQSIRNATLNLYIDNGDDNYSERFQIRKITSNWDQTVIRNTTQLPAVSDDYLEVFTGPFGRESWSGIPMPGWLNIDITSFVQGWVNGNSNYGVRIENVNGKEKDIISSDIKYAPDMDKKPNLIVDYNLTPSTPQVISPNGGDNIDGAYSILWSGSSDDYTTQPHLKYDLEYSTNGGTTWARIVSALEGQTSFTYDFSSASPSTSALVRVRSYDGMVYSPWDQSDAPFTIQHNRAPNAPSGLNPGSTSSTAPTFVAGVTPTLNWTFSDPDAGDTQSAYQVLLYNTSNGLVYDSGWVTSSAKSFTVPTNKLVRGTAYYWKVLVKDSKGAASSASNAMYIKCNTIPTLNLTSYANNTSVPDNVLTFTWTFTDGDGQAQSGVQIQGSKDNFATIAYNSGTINGTATSFTTPALASGTWSFRVMASDGVEWSAYSQRTGLSLPNTFEPNDTTATATPAIYGTYTTLINSTTDVDFFKYTASTIGVNRVQLTPPAGKNYDVYVYDSSNTLLAAGVRGAGVSENIIYEVAAGGTYYVKIVGVSGEYSTTATYSLTISSVNFKTQTTYDYDSNGNLKTKTTSVIP